MNLFINYVSFPMTAEQLKNKISFDGQTDMQLLVERGYCEWTVSPKAKKGDLVVFYHTNGVLERIKNIEKEARENEKLFEELKGYIELSYDYFEKYGSSLFAIGVIGDDPENDEDAFDFETHFKSRCFAEIEDCCVLKNPIKTNQLKGLIDLKSQASKEPINIDSARELISMIYKNENLTEGVKNAIDLFMNNMQ